MVGWGTQHSREGFSCCRLSLDFDSQVVCTFIVDALTLIAAALT